MGVADLRLQSAVVRRHLRTFKILFYFRKFVIHTIEITLHHDSRRIRVDRRCQALQLNYYVWEEECGRCNIKLNCLGCLIQKGDQEMSRFEVKMDLLDVLAHNMTISKTLQQLNGNFHL